MRVHWVGFVLMAGLLSQEAYAADMTRTRIVMAAAPGIRLGPVQPERAVARLVDRGIGYSVLHEAVGVPQRSYRVHVTCTLTETFAQTYCPTPAYVSYCPNATIVCR